MGAAVGAMLGVLAVVISHNLPNYRPGEKYYEPTSLLDRGIEVVVAASIGAVVLGLLVGLVTTALAAVSVFIEKRDLPVWGSAKP